MANYYIMPDSLEDRRRPTSRFKERDHDPRSLARRLEEAKREMKEVEELFKKKEEPKKGQLSNLEIAFTLCLGIMIFGPFILWAQVAALHQISQNFAH